MANSVPPPIHELPEEFKDAVPLEKFHRYAIAASSGEVRAYFGLIGSDGSHNYYYADPATIIGLAGNMAGLAGQSKIVAESGAYPIQPIPFETNLAFAGVAHGGPPTERSVLLFLSNKTGAQIVTALRPDVGAMLAKSLLECLASLPTPPPLPPHPTALVNVPGREPKSETEVYFGQQYKTAILQAFGVLMIRANLLDRGLILLFQAVTALPPEQAEAIYYSTQNFKARTDMIRAAVSQSNLASEHKAETNKALERANAVAGRRNDLVHADWSFDGDRMTASSYRPNTKRQRSAIKVNAKDILAIADDYRVAGVMLESFAASLLSHNAKNARNTASMRPSGEPSS